MILAHTNTHTPTYREGIKCFVCCTDYTCCTQQYIMTLPTNTTLSAVDDDSDMFGPPRTSPLRHTRPRVPMISAKLRLREERKRILQLCAHKLERIKDSETNLRRSVCINNTYSRLTDEVRREKQSRYLANLPK